jgi:signal transduction histidine kinase
VLAAEDVPGEKWLSRMRVSFARRCFRPHWFLLAVLSGFLLLPVVTVATSSPPPRKNVLIISEVGLGHSSTALITNRLLLQLSASHEYQVEFYFDSLDTTSLVSEESLRKKRASTIQEYQDHKVDVIVAMGPMPIKLLSQVSETFLPDVPVVICGTSEEQAGYPKLGARFTGSWINVEPAKTVDLALKLFPETKHVVVVGGTSPFDRGIEGIMRSSQNSYPALVDFTYLTDLEMPTLQEQLGHLPSQTVILYTSFFRDAAGSQFVNATTALPLVSEAANAPVFGISDTYLGHGIVGGYVISFADQGKITAHIISELFDGKAAKDIPIVTRPGLYMFDWPQLQRWKLRNSELPAGSIVLRQMPTLWEQAKWILLAGLLMVLSLGCLSAYLLYKQKQLDFARKEQVRLSRMLINAQEEERSRLAAEIHDDFSQRLALLSLGLEMTAEGIPQSMQETNRQMLELINSASELGADLHTLSHGLHSSTLAKLGLVAGVASFCKEFTAQQGVQVTFSHQNIPRSVSPEIALCLFRIVQEGLRNVKKHSGAVLTQVRLEIIEDMLYLSMSDTGKGFDKKEVSERQGLGLWIMEERVRSLGGRFEIHSELLKGTVIDVWTPLREKSDTTRSEPISEPIRASAVASGQSAD